MNKINLYIFSFLCIILTLIGFYAFSLNDKNDDFSEKTKIALREVGNQLLLKNNDSTSLVLPIVKIDEYKFLLEFEASLSIEPNDLVFQIDDAFNKAILNKNYRVEVKQCENKEVAYSYEISKNVENTIIPCSGRFLPEKCYQIELRFLNKTASTSYLAYILMLVIILMAFLIYRTFKTEKVKLNKETEVSEFKSLGDFKFYPEQHKLIKEAVEVKLSKKECELLELFIASPNQIITREELTKRVWEDHGVVVGRSLDTYISKLRKILKDDPTIKLTNVHGVGYKLELN